MRTTIALAVASLVLVGCADPDSGPAAEPKATQLEEAYDSCDVTSEKVRLADGNQSILVEGAMSDDFTDVACILIGLETPEYVVSSMDNTTAMMGRQHEEADGLSYDWSYHPDNGMDIVIHEV